MHNKIKKQLKKYINYLDSLPDTKCNQMLKDYSSQVANVVPETKELFNAK